MTGGSAVLLTFGTGVGAALLASGRWAPLAPYGGELLLLLVGVLVLHVMGWVDDRRDLGVWLRLATQLGVALLLSNVLGLRVLPEWLGATMGMWVASIWLVALINAFNFLDGLDGLAAGVGTICTALVGAVALTLGQPEWTLLASLLCGALAGFLVFNLPPASLYLGDAGSQPLGLLVGYLALRPTYHDPAAALGTPWHAVFIPLAILAIPLYDLASVLAIRLHEGRSLFTADRRHLSHRLRDRGLTDAQTLVVICLCAMATGLGGLVLPALDTPRALLVAFQTLAVLSVVALLERSAGSP